MKGMKSLNGYSLVDATARSGVEENAKNIQTNAQAIQTNADAIQTNAEAIQNNLENIQTNTQNIQTNAETIQTNAENITRISEELESLEQQHQSDLTTTAQNFTNQINAAVQPISEGVNTNASAIEQLSTQQSETSEKVSQNTSKLEELAQGQAGIGEQVTQLSEEISCDEPYKQLVTDGEGKTVWEDRLAYSELKEVVFVDKVSVQNDFTFPLLRPLAEGDKCFVNWDGVEYTCIAKEYDGYIMIGNNAIYEYDGDDETDTGEPFAIEAELENTAAFVYTASGDGNAHVLSIYGIAEVVSPIDPKFYDFSTKSGKTKVVNAVVYREVTLEIGVTKLEDIWPSSVQGQLGRVFWRDENGNNRSYLVVDIHTTGYFDSDIFTVMLTCVTSNLSKSAGFKQINVDFAGYSMDAVATSIQSVVTCEIPTNLIGSDAGKVLAYVGGELKFVSLSELSEFQ